MLFITQTIDLRSTLTDPARLVLAESGGFFMGNSTMLALGLMVAGALVLRHALLPRKSKEDPVLSHPGRVVPFSALPTSPPHNTSSPFDSDAPRGSFDDSEMEAVLVEVKHLRRVLAEETDRHAERLEVLIARAEETIRKLESLPQARGEGGVAGVSGGTGRGAAAPAAPVVDPLNRRIYELADQGLSSLDIARSLNQQTGKVELVLALRPR